MHHRRRGDCLRAVGTTGSRPNTPTNRRNTSPTCASNSARCAWSASSWGLLLGGPQLGRGIRTNGLSKRSKASQPSIFGVLGRMNRPQLSCFCPHLFRPFLISKLRRSHCSAFPVSEQVVADKKASFLSPVAQNGYVPLPSCWSSQPQTPDSTRKEAAP